MTNHNIGNPHNNITDCCQKTRRKISSVAETCRGGGGEDFMHKSGKLTETYVRYNRHKYQSCRTHFVEFELVVVNASR